MKKCGSCKLVKDDSDFFVNKSRKDGKSPYCRPCTRAKAKEWYHSSPDRVSQIRGYQKRTRARNMKYLGDYLTTHPCVDCGESDPVVLEFDHVRGEKRAALSTMACNCNTLEVLNEEIAKCDVRCANCHRRKTAKERGWWAYDTQCGEELDQAFETLKVNRA